MSPGESGAPATVPLTKTAPRDSEPGIEAGLRQRIRALEQRIAAMDRRLHENRQFRSAVALGLGNAGLPLPVEASSTDVRKHVLASLNLLGGQSAFARSLGQGNPLDIAVIDMVRELLVQRQQVKARSIGHSLLNGADTEQLGHAVMGLVAMYQETDELAEHHLQALEPQTARRLLPAEWMDFRFDRDPDGVCLEITRHSEVLLASDRLRFRAVTLALRERRDAFARDLLSALEAERGDSPDLDARQLEDYRWLRQWVRTNADEASGHRQWRAESVNIGVLDYKGPDFLRQSNNIGDYVQTIGSLTHLARFQNVHFFGAEGLTRTLENLQRRTTPVFRADLPQRTDVNIVRVDRDDSRRNHVPEDTWLVAFGWYMRSPFLADYDFPFAENINPLFISFHVNRREMLTDEAVAYLRKHAPIGCRDWSTVYLLRSLNIPCFFSGCITTTVDAVFPTHPGPADQRSRERHIAVVDKPLTPEIRGILPDGSHVESISQASADVGWASLETNVSRALELLTGYRRYDRIITSRLHCYLPATALGCTVDFVPAQMGDVRFDGLLNLTPDSFELGTIQEGIRSKLEAVYRLILSGAGKEEVYALWRQITEEEVAAVEAICSKPFEFPEPHFDVAAACDTILAGRREFGFDREGPAAGGTGVDAEDEAVHVALATDQNLRAEVPVVVQSILSEASRPVHFWVLTRGLGDDYFAALAQTFTEARFTFLPCDQVDYGEIQGMLRHITVSTMDRLLLPLLLTDVDRVVYHDIDAVTVDDITDLYAADLGDAPLAGRSSTIRWAASGFGNVYRAANRLNAEAAAELRRGMHATLPYDFTTFNAGIIVMDLSRMRADDFCHRYVGMAAHFGMNDQDILNCYAGGNRAALDSRWNTVPQQEVAVDPKVLHWAGAAKPWGAEYVVHQEIWDGFVAGYQSRATSAGTLGVLAGTEMEDGS